MAKKKKKSVRSECINFTINSWLLHKFIIEIAKQKLGDVEIKSLEFTGHDDNDCVVLNCEDNNFDVFVEYEREE